MKNTIVRIFFLVILTLPMIAPAQQSQGDIAVDEGALGEGALKDDAKQQQETPENNIKSAPQDGDFKPSEEISEDFPVPLPSDI